MQPDTKTIEKIRKLLALAKDGGATEAEAALAMQLAQEKMAEFNLSAAMFEAAGGEKEGRAKEFSRLPLLYKWKRDLLEALAKVNYCYLDISADLKSYNVIGRKSNIAAMNNMFEYLTQTIERLLVNEVGKSPQARYNKWSHSFRLGCSERLIRRIKDRHEKQLADQERKAREERARASHPAYAGQNALVIVLRDYAQEEQDLNNDMRFGWEPGTTAARRAKLEAEQQEIYNRYHAKKKALIEQGIPENVATYMACGFSRERAEELCTPPKPETDAQRRKREEREARAWKRREERERRQQSKVNWDGYETGRRRANEIGLDEQISHNPAKHLG